MEDPYVRGEQMCRVNAGRQTMKTRSGSAQRVSHVLRFDEASPAVLMEVPGAGWVAGKIECFFCVPHYVLGRKPVVELRKS